MPASKYELRNGTGTRFVFPEVSVNDIRNNVSGYNSTVGGGGSRITISDGGSNNYNINYNGGITYNGGNIYNTYNNGGGTDSVTVSTFGLPGSTNTNYINCTPCAPCNPADCSVKLENCKAESRELIEDYNELIEDYNEIVEALEKSCDTRPPGGFWEDRAKIWSTAFSGSCDNYFHFAEASVSATFSQEVTFLGNSIGYGYALIKNTTQIALYSVKRSLESYPYGPALPPRNPSFLPRSLCNGDLNIQVAKDLGNGQFGNLQDGINSTTGTGRYGVFSRAQFDERAPGGFYYNKPSLPSTIQLGWFTYLGNGQYEYEAMEDDPCGNPIAPTHRVTYNAGTGGTISGIDVQNIPTGEVSQTVSAVADAGYTFTGWSDGSTINPRTDVDVQSIITVTANFVLTP